MQCNNELRSNLSREETKRIREKLYKKEAVYNFSKEKDCLTDKEKIVLKNIAKYLKKLNNDLKNIYKHEDNVMYGLDYLFNKVNEKDYYEPKERVLLMVVIYYMKKEGIKMLN